MFITRQASITIQLLKTLKLMPSALIYHYMLFMRSCNRFSMLTLNVMIAVGSRDSSLVDCCCRTCLLGRLGLKQFRYV